MYIHMVYSYTNIVIYISSARNITHTLSLALSGNVVTQMHKHTYPMQIE